MVQIEPDAVFVLHDSGSYQHDYPGKPFSGCFRRLPCMTYWDWRNSSC